MIPQAAALIGGFEWKKQPGYTYRMDGNAKSICGYVDALDAVRQAVFKILNTERYAYEMYSWNYGIELKDLYGMPVGYVCPELERRITEALTWDDRIDSVDGFSFDIRERGVVKVSFTVHSVAGQTDEEFEVSI